MQFLPVHIDTANKDVWVFGGGSAAEAKLRTLVKSKANIRVFADHQTSEIHRWAEKGRVVLEDASANFEAFPRPVLIYTAQPDEDLNLEMAKWARDNGILINAADQKNACDFHSPAIVDRSPVIVSIGSGGTSPGLARALKNKIEQFLPDQTGRIASSFGDIRARLSALLPSADSKQKIWAQFFGNHDLEEILSGAPSQLEAQVLEALNQDEQQIGSVSLVGAGPGDFELLTFKAARLLEQADVVIYDRLVGERVLDLARREAKFIYVGKTPYKASISQADINEIIIEEARQGHKVVRLKGGDPSIFGRADEEINALRNAEIPYEIVPGITAAAASAASAGISLTTREHNRSVTFMTGHGAKGYAEHDWKVFAEPGARAAVYMGVGAARFIQGRLLIHGANKSKPVTIVENASLETEKIVHSNLENLPQDLEKYGINGPAILLLGYASDFEISEEKLREKAVS